MQPLFPIEINFTLFLQALGQWLTGPFKLITSLGNEQFYILAMPLLYWCFDATMGIRIGIMLLVTGGFKDFLKVIFHTPRPYWVDTRVQAITSETSFGMPSGHSMDAASIWGAVASSQKRRWITWLAIALIFLIGLSRIYLGVHFLHDVLTGWLFGALLLWAYLKLEKRLINWIKPKSLAFQVSAAFILSIVLIALAVFARLLVSGWQMPATWTDNALAAGAAAPDPLNIHGVITLAGVAFGMLGGLAVWVKKYGTPKVGKKTYKLILRYLVGMAGVAVLYLGLKLVFPEEPEILGLVLRYVRYALLGAWVTLAGPLLFKKLKI